MKRKIGIIGLVTIAVTLSAGVRTPADALRIAKEFTSVSASGPSVKRSNRQSSSNSASDLSLADSSAVYLAVNTADGYVLVGADERLPEVLGYSDNGAFDADNLSPAFRYWMECYEEELAAAGDSSLISNDQSPIINHQPRRAVAAVSPLCSSRWNQSAPYNNYAPAYNDQGSKCVTGCVATAMAQIMYYHKHPTIGTGSHSYLWECTEPVGKSATLSANFGQTTYRWADMRDSHRSGTTAEQDDAVATLMYHCGVSVNMGYGQSSGAYTEKVPPALKDYFSYDANYQRIQKVMYPADSLNAIIAAELKAKRPVLVSGHNSEGGHAFVCDGCDNKGYFHINWGWGGSNDGYFLLTALNPGSSQGIGGTTKGYNKSTCFFIGLQPAKSGTPKAIPQIATTKFTVSSESFDRSASFSVSIARLENFGLTNFSGSYGVALYDEDETKLITVIKQKDNCSITAGWHYTTASTLSSITIPNTVPNGTYHLCCVYRDANYGWMRMLCTEDDYFMTLTLTSSTATFYPNDAEPELALTKAIAFPAGTNLDSVPKTGLPLSFAIKNTGGTFKGEISARIYLAKNGFSRGQYEIMDSVVVRRNQSLSSALQQKFDAALLLDTQYKMRLCWKADESEGWHDFTPASYCELSFKLYDPEYHLSLTDTIHFDRNDSVPRDNANLYYSIKNTGAAFDGEIQVFYYQGPFARGKSEIRSIHVGTGETLEDAFSGELEQVPGTYTVILRYRELDGDWQEFIDKNYYNLGMITATVVPASPLELFYTDDICEGENYAGYGFNIEAAQLPAFGNSKDFFRSNPDKYLRDSLITLTLTVTKADTLSIEDEILNTALPYKVGEDIIIPAGASIGLQDPVLRKTDSCAYKLYVITVEEVTPDPPTEIENTEYRVQNTDTRKILRNGTLLIIHDGKTYNAQGQLIQ